MLEERRYRFRSEEFEADRGRLADSPSMEVILGIYDKLAQQVQELTVQLKEGRDEWAKDIAEHVQFNDRLRRYQQFFLEFCTEAGIDSTLPVYRVTRTMRSAAKEYKRKRQSKKRAAARRGIKK